MNARHHTQRHQWESQEYRHGAALIKRLRHTVYGRCNQLVLVTRAVEIVDLREGAAVILLEAES